MSDELARLFLNFALVIGMYALAMNKNRWEVYLISAFTSCTCTQFLFNESIFYGAISMMLGFSALFRTIWVFIGTKRVGKNNG